MYILLPMDSKGDEASLVKLDDVNQWTQICVEDGQIKEINYGDEKNAFTNPSECVVVVSDNEYVWPFMELNMMVLVAHTQRDLDDILEAYLFKELHDLAY